jgi:hypothetical protein
MTGTFNRNGLTDVALGAPDPGLVQDPGALRQRVRGLGLRRRSKSRDNQ